MLFVFFSEFLRLRTEKIGGNEKEMNRNSWNIKKNKNKRKTMKIQENYWARVFSHTFFRFTIEKLEEMKKRKTKGKYWKIVGFVFFLIIFSSAYEKLPPHEDVCEKWREIPSRFSFGGD